MKKKMMDETEKAHIPIKWEFEAFKELRNWCIERWNNDEEFLNEAQLNSLIIENLQNDKTKFKQFVFQSEDKELTTFYQFTFDGFIIREPILFRIFLHNSTLPEDIHVREALRLTCIPNKEIDRFRDYFKRDILIDSELARGISFKGIPLRCFFIGHIINQLIEDFGHYALIDEVKKRGAQEPIEALREKRIYENNEGIVHDYSPIFKKTYTNKGIKIEYFEKKDFDNHDWLSFRVDDLLCGCIQKTQHDRRRDYYFGNNLNTSKFRFIICFKGQEKEIPFQLLPKYKPLILKTVRNYSLTEIETKNDEDSEDEKKYKEDEKQEAMIGLFQGALTWDINSGASTHWLSENLKWQLSNAFDELSTESYKKERLKKHIAEIKTEKHFQDKILKESLESSENNLEDRSSVFPIQGGNKMTFNPKNDPEERVLLSRVIRSKVCREEPRMKNILAKQEEGKALTSAERKTYERIIKKLKKKYS